MSSLNILNNQLQPGTPCGDVTVRVVVLPGKRLVLANPYTPGVKVLPSGTEVHGIIVNINDTEWVIFPTLEAGLELTKLRQRWDDLIVDAWRRSSNDTEEELFQ